MHPHLQAMFTYIVIVALMTSEFDKTSAAGYRRWRRNVAHDVEHIEPISGESLAAKVCANDPGLGAYIPA